MALLQTIGFLDRRLKLNVKKIFCYIFGGFIVALLTFIWRKLRKVLFDNGVSTDGMGTISRRTGECKEQLERDSETVGDIIERQRDLIREIREKQKLEQ